MDADEYECDCYVPPSRSSGLESSRVESSVTAVARFDFTHSVESEVRVSIWACSYLGLLWPITPLW